MGTLVLVAVVMVATVMVFSGIHIQQSAGSTGGNIALDSSTNTLGLQSLPQSYGAMPTGAKLVSQVADTTPVNFEITLAIQDTPQEQAFMNGLVTPGSQYYQHYMSYNHYVGLYGPSNQTVQNLIEYLQGNGLAVTSTGGILMWKVSGTAAQVDQALHTTLWQWNDGSATAMAPLGAPQLPANLAPWVESFSGLNGFDAFHPLFATPTSPATTLAETTPSVMRGFYGEAGLISNGTTGVLKIGLAEECSTDETNGNGGSGYTSDLSDLDSAYGLPAPTITYIGDGAASCSSANSGWNTETDLDIQWSHVMAPTAPIVVCLDTSNPDDCDQTFVTDGIPFGSNSFGGGSSDHSVWQAAEAAGVTLLASAGDSGAAAQYPASEPDGIGVGGTTITPSGSTYDSETAWADSGGGCDTSDAPPSYQIGMTGYPGACSSTSDRGVPDVSMDADPNSGVPVYVNGASEQIGGTSLSCPMWAASLDVIYDASGFSGFAGPTLYSLAKSSSYHSVFHDVTTGSNGYSATAGWDPVTGVGTPNIGGLAKNFVTPLAGSLSPKTASVEAGTPVNFTVTASGGSTPYTYQWELNGTVISGAPSTSTYTFYPGNPASYQISVVVKDNASKTLTLGPAYVNSTAGPTAGISANPTTAYGGQTVTLTASASGGSGTYTKYVWYSNGTSFGTTVAGSNTWVAPGHTTTYTLGVRVYDSTGGSGFASTVVSTLAYTKPTVSLSVNPTGMVDVSSAVTLSATATGGQAPFTYVFMTNGTNTLQNSTSSSYLWLPTGAGAYSLTVKVIDGLNNQATSGKSTVLVNPRPSVALSNLPSSMDLGNSITLTANESGGTSPIDYAFMENGTTPLANSSSPTYSWDPTGAATYSISVEVFDELGVTATSSSQSVTVNPAIVVTLDKPSPSAVDVGQSSTVNAAVSGGTAPYTYQWTVNGARSSLSSSNSIVYPTTTSGQVKFIISVTDAAGDNVQSSSVTLSVNNLPQVSINGNNTPYAGTTDDLTAAVTGGTGALTYAWSVNSAAQSGATGQVFAFNESEAGSYQVTVTVTDAVNGVGTSQAFTVTVVSQSGGGNSPPWYENSPIPGIANATLGWLLLLAIVVVVAAVVVAAVRRRKQPSEEQPIGVMCGCCGAGPYPWGTGGCAQCGVQFANVTPMTNSANYVAYPNAPQSMPPWPGPPVQ
jgi:hypothetical protein